MSYKTVLVHVDDSGRAGERIRIAAQIAQACDGYLIGAALTGVSRFLYQSDLSSDDDPNLALHLTFLRERATRALAAFETELAGTGLSAFDKRVVDDEAGGGICLHARAADLVVIGQASPDDPSTAAMSDFPADVVINSGRPVLLIPYAGVINSVGKRILVAWDGSKEAARAVTLALPLLQTAAWVQVALIDPAVGAKLVSPEVGEQVLAFLARHGIAAELSRHPSGALPLRRHEVGETLLSLATDRAADLLVMGAYGHSRFRETILGGVTRTVLESMTIPTLMSH